jgi:hypothetical protein
MHCSPSLSLPSVTLGKAFAECFQGFAECFRHSAKRLIPVVVDQEREKFGADGRENGGPLAQRSTVSSSYLYRCPSGPGPPGGPRHDTKMARPRTGTTQLLTCLGWPGPFAVSGWAPEFGPSGLTRPGPSEGEARGGPVTLTSRARRAPQPSPPPAVPYSHLRPLPLASPILPFTQSPSPRSLALDDSAAPPEP